VKVAFLDPFCGISGDMFVACFLDAGLDLEAIEGSLAELPVAGYRISRESVMRGALKATRFVVEVEEHGHEHRKFADIESLIGGSGLAAPVKEAAISIFRVLAEAEGEVHGVSAGEVTFHEVGAVDSIVDIVAAATALHAAGVEDLVVGPLRTGRGSVETAHGELPLPAPATARLLRGFDVIPSDVGAELVTPTGAAIVKARGRPARGAGPALRLEAVGVGAGARVIENFPNVARVFIGEPRDESGGMRPVDVVETTIDDATPELVAHVSSSALEAGAHDAFITPVIMKKGRPGVLLTVLSPPDLTEALVARIFRETPTLGIRVSNQQRFELERKVETVTTKFGEIPVKVSTDSDGRRRAHPEYEPCAAAARASGAPLSEVFEEARRAWEKSQRR